MSSADPSPECYCIRCHNAPELYVALECHHTYCIACLTYIVIKRRSQTGSQDEALCSICQQLSVLDSAAVNFIENYIQGQLRHKLQHLENTEHTHFQDSQQFLHQHILEEYEEEESRSEDPIRFDSPKTNNHLATSEFRLVTNHGHGDKYRSNQRLMTSPKMYSEEASFEHITPSTKYFFSKCDSPSEKVSGLRDSCEMHPLEQPNLVCLTCDNSLLCFKCVVTKKHEDHNIMPVNKGMEYLAEQIGFRKLEVNERIEMLQIKQRRIHEHKQSLAAKAEKTKHNIRESLEQVIIVVKKKEAELLNRCEEMMQGFWMLLDKDIEYLQRKIFNLKKFRFDYKTLKDIQEAKNSHNRPEHSEAQEFFKIYKKLNINLQENLSEEDHFGLKGVLTPSHTHLNQIASPLKNKTGRRFDSLLRDWDVALADDHVVEAIRSLNKIGLVEKSGPLHSPLNSSINNLKPINNSKETVSLNQSALWGQNTCSNPNILSTKESMIRQKLKTENYEQSDQKDRFKECGRQIVSQHVSHISRSPESIEFEASGNEASKKSRDLPEYIGRFLQKNKYKKQLVSENSSEISQNKSKGPTSKIISSEIGRTDNKGRGQRSGTSLSSINTNPLTTLLSQKQLFENKKSKMNL